MHSARYHLIFDITDCQNVENAEVLKKFVEETIAAIGMQILYGPVVCLGVPQNPGLSCFGVLDFSHISIHTFSQHQEVLVDIFSCRAFDRHLVRRQYLKYFATARSGIRAKEVWWGTES